MAERESSITRKTAETNIQLTWRADGTGKANIATGIGFFDHMLNNFARHGFFDLEAEVRGDLYVDTHHTVEDVGIVLGQAIEKALGDKCGINRYGYAVIPMDETLMLCSLDLCGRPYFNMDVELTTDRVGDFETEMVREFFYAVSYSAGMNLHFVKLAGSNNHHMIEAMFKAFAKALDTAAMIEERNPGVLSTKGSL